VARLHSGGYSLRTRFGPAGVSWQYDAAQKVLRTNVTVPVGGASAEVRHEEVLPGADSCVLAAVHERGAELWSVGARSSSSSSSRSSSSSSTSGGAGAILPAGVLGLHLRDGVATTAGNANDEAADRHQRRQQRVLASTTVGSGQYSFVSQYE
jgi:hypothetical protein